MTILSSHRDIRFLGEINFADAGTITWKSGSIPGTALAAGANILRTQMAISLLNPLTIPLNKWGVSATLALLGAAAGTPTGAFGLTPGVHGVASAKLAGETANNNTKTNTGRTLAQVPAKFEDGTSLLLRVHARITVDVAGAQTLDLTAYESDTEAGISADLCATNAVTLSTAWADIDYTITATNIAAGDWLDLQLSGVANDTGGSAGAEIEIGDTRFIASLRG